MAGFSILRSDPTWAVTTTSELAAALTHDLQKPHVAVMRVLGLHSAAIGLTER